MIASILAFFATITEVNEQGMSVLLESIWVIPSLLMHLMMISTPVFEADDALLKAPEAEQLRWAP